MRVLVCGGRKYNDRAAVWRELDALPISFLIEGGSTGADELAKRWALFNKVEHETFEADWNNLGLAAGPIRNQQMIDDGRPNLVVAFPGNRGTADMIGKAERAGIPVKRVSR